MFNKLGYFAASATSTFGQVDFISFDGSNDLIADKTQDATLNAADYVVYVWSKDGSTYSSFNSPMRDTVAKDYNRFGNVTSLVGGAAYNGAEDAFLFDGVDGYIDYGHPPGAELPGNTGVTMTYKFNSITAGAFDDKECISFGYGTEGARTPWVLTCDGRFQLRAISGATSTLDWVPGALLTWHTVVISITATGAISIYFNDMVNTAVTGVAPVITEIYGSSPAALLQLGGTHVSRYRNMYMRDYAVYPSVLSEEQRVLLLNDEQSVVAAEESTVGESWGCTAYPITSGVVGAPVVAVAKSRLV